MNKTIYTILLALLLLHSASAEIISTSATPLPAYTQYALNLTDAGVDTQLEIVNCLMLLSTGNFVDQNTTIADAILRNYTNGTKQYYLSFEKNDTSLNTSTLQQFQAIIRLDSSSLYVLKDFLTLEAGVNGTANLVSFANNIVSPPANTLTEVVGKLSTGFTLLSQTDIANDQNLKAIDESFRRLYGLNEAILSYVASSASQTQGAFKGYRVFYSSEAGTINFKLKIGSAVYNSDAKAYYLHSILDVKLPSYITLN